MMAASGYSKVLPVTDRSSADPAVWLTVGASVLVVAGLAASGPGQLLRAALAGAGTLVGLVLYLRRPMLYLQYSIWVWFLSPLVRRLVDWRFGWMDPNLVLLTPLLVSGISGLTLLRRNRSRGNAIPPAFALCAAAILYGFVVGMILKHSLETVYGLFNWMCPLLFGLHLYLNSEHYEAQRKAVGGTILWATLALGSYGICQFLLAPAWDRSWLENVSLGLLNPSFGRPEPLLLRVWSTMNAPGPFANTMMAGLLLLFCTRSALRLPAALAGYLSLLLSGVRTAWLGWAVGLVMLVATARPRVIVKLTIFMIVLLVCLVPLASDPRLAPVIQDRTATLTELKSDESLGARSEMYEVLTTEVIDTPFGHGLQNQEVSRGIVVDSGFLTVVLSLGWAGSLLFAAGVCFLLLGPGTSLAMQDRFLFACKAIVLANLTQLVGGNIFVNVFGALFWTFSGVYVSGIAHHAARPALAEN
jgi:hypothetical protein